MLWGIWAYAIQIYADFSGYTDIAIGIALLLGIRFPQNFDAPYRSLSFQDFWRRWHMTLSRWLRDYLYIPLGGNRGSDGFVYRNLMLTMVIGGLWHGANWTFVIWGFIQGSALVVERVVKQRWARRPAPHGPAHLAGARPAVVGDLPGGVPGLGVLPGPELLRRHGRAGPAVPRRRIARAWSPRC